MIELNVQTSESIVGPLDDTPTPLTMVRPALVIRSFGLTDKGKVREGNEDQFLIASLVKVLQVHATSFPQPSARRSSDLNQLFVVADGMGGHAGGERASALAIDSVERFVLETFRWFAQCKGREQDQLLASFQRALGKTNARVLAEAELDPTLHGMGTTVTMALCLGDELFVAHVGDSRCYVLREGHLTRLTSDHTLVQEMVEQGTLKAEDAPTHRWRHVITNAVGGDTAEVKVEVHQLQLEVGDRVLLCSDGLTGMLSDDEIARILQNGTEPESMGRALVVRANEEGGKDNITVIVACCDAETSNTSR